MPSGNAPLTSYLSQGTLGNYEPSWRDRAAYWLAQNWYGDNREGVQKANRLMNVADVTPVGIPLALDDAARAFGRGNYAGGAVTLAMAGIPAVRKEAKLTGKAAQDTLDAILEKHGLTQPKTIRAYHGSPHSFDKFDMSKIGTGEGAQAYGHGLYFAENEGVAQNYRDQLAKSQIDFGGNRMQPAEVSDLLWKQSGNDSPEFLRGVMDAVHEMTATGKAPTPPADLSSWMGYGPMAQKEGFAYAANQLSNAKASSGSMYEVQINADPEQFLDWDKPLSEQPESVRKAISPIFAGNDEINSILSSSTGEDITRRLLPMAGIGRGGHDTAHDLISDELKKRNIPGIKYLDQGSRVQGRFSQQLDDLRNKLAVAESKLAEATNRGRRHSAMVHSKEVDDLRNKIALAEKPQSRNYVVFDDRLITILRKYGLLPPIAAGAAYGASQDQQQSAY